MPDPEKIRILIVDDIADTRENLAKLIGFEPDLEIAGMASGGQMAIDLAKRERPNVILMDINMPDMDGITATEIIANTVPESPIIMMSIQGEQDYLRRSMLAGAREFLVKPISTDELVNAIRHVHELEKVKRARYTQPAPVQSAGGGGTVMSLLSREKGKIISFFSPKGGVGRTTIATNLAVALHQATGKPVVLVDGSLPFGDVAVILNMSPKAKTIADLVGSFDNADAEVLETVLVSHSTGIKVLLAPPTPEAAELITGANMKHVLEVLRESYAYVIVDTWPSFLEVVLTMLDVADVIITLMTLEITSLKNVRVFMEITEKLGYDEKVQLVANRNDSSGGIKPSDVEASLGRKIPHTIVSDGRTLVLAVNRGVPFVISHRDSQVSKDIFTLAARLSGDEEQAANAAPAKPAQKQGLRLFGGAR
ncbi:MAG: response regulator [Chloroflexi bacterium]|nr:response regulator [Chloroflexota bacterium]